MNDLTQSRWLPVVLLTCSNIFMTFAWRGLAAQNTNLTIENMNSYFEV
jgi:uncharacterized protein (DUF486 family)